MSTKTNEPALESLGRLVGTWTTEATHRLLPGVVLRGTVSGEWLEGERFIGFTDQDRAHKGAATPAADGERRLTMHYFDSRGVFRVFDASIDDQAWRIWREAPGFSQRFTGSFADGGATIAGVWQLCEDDVNWNDDLRITYRRR